MPLFKYSRSVINQIDVDLALPVFSLLGQTGTDGAFTIPRLSFYCKMRDIINSAVSLHLLQISGYIEVPVEIVGSFTFPKMVVFSDMQAEGKVDLFPLRVLGILQNHERVDGLMQLPVLEVSAVIQPVQLIDAAFQFPCITCAAYAVKSSEGMITGNVTISLLQILGILFSESAYSFQDETDVIFKYSKDSRKI